MDVYCSSEEIGFLKLKMSDFIILHEEDIRGAKLPKNPSAWNMKELLRWLECHGLKEVVKTS